MIRLAGACALATLLVGGGAGPGAAHPLGPGSITAPRLNPGPIAALRLGPGPTTLDSVPLTALATYSAPVTPVQVVRGFEPPPTPYAAGHRGVDLATADGAVIRAASAGRVRFAGQVAGRGVVVIAHPDGVSTEYEPVQPLIHGNDPVQRGQPIGRVLGRHGACPASRCLHWGARLGGMYFDPLSLLRTLGPVRLLPWTI